MTEKILFVDDEQNVLDGFRRQLRRKYDIATAASGPEGLLCLSEQGPFAVVVSDMRMPIMDGIAFLREVRRHAPETVRMMLTGNADQQTAVDAINQGAIFRFLTKPCTTEDLIAALEAGKEQHRLVTAEKELLEKTLKGSIKVLVDILSLANPVAFSQANRLRRFSAQIVSRLGLTPAWQYELATLLSALGFINVPSETIEKYLSGSTLTPSEKEMIAALPQTTGMLLANIPRLSAVASMITFQDKSCDAPLNFGSTDPAEVIRIGANLLKTLRDFDLLLNRDIEPEEAVRMMAAKGDAYDANLLDMLVLIDLPRKTRVSRTVPLADLEPGMIIDENIVNTRGILVIPRGFDVNDTTCSRLKNFLAAQGGHETVRVLLSVYEEDAKTV